MRAKSTVVKLAAAVAAGLALMFCGAQGALAEDPVSLGSDYVYDGSDVLASSELDAANTRLEKLAQDTDVALWVVYVPTFENPTDAREWADETALDNGLGVSQYLLAISTDGRTLYLSGDSAGPVDDDTLDDIQNDVLDALGGDQTDWASAVTVAADGLDKAVNPASSSGWALIIGFVVVAGIVIVVIVIITARKRRRTAVAAGGSSAPGVPAPSANDSISTADLQQQAAAALVASDDDTRSSEQELGFAEAQFGADATKEFTETLQQAKASMAQAFELKQKLDDSEKDTEEEVRAWNGQIIQLCQQASAALEEKAASFADLRKLEQNAPEALALAQERRTQAKDAPAEAQKALAALQQQYAASALTSVADNPQQATDRLAFADQKLTEAQQQIGGGKGGEAAVAIRAAEEAIAQAHKLRTSIDELGASLGAAEKQANDLVAELGGEIAQAKQLPDAQGQLAGAIARAETALEQAKQNTQGTGRDPQALLDSLQKADAEIDQAIAG
ncbi:MAG: TPM domain-containing protein, partial [Microbacterium sp.]